MAGQAHIGSLQLRNLVKAFGTFRGVDDVSLDIEQGEFLTLLGPSGSGKTTLLMMIAGFLDITSGDILLDGTSIARRPAEKRNFGMVFQGYALFPHMTVRDNVAYALDVRKRPRAEIDARVDEMLKLVQLENFADRKPAQLSGGQQQRVALARAMSFSPPVLLLDEPLGALDKKLRIEVQEQLKDIHKRVGTTFIYVTHDQEEALSMSDRIVIMRDGRIEQVGTPLDLYERPATRFSASFLGKSNFLHLPDGTYALRPEKIDIVSIRHDPQFGPAMTLGSGGILVELIADAAGYAGAFHISLDPTGMPAFSGGGCVSPRDLARFGLLFHRIATGRDDGFGNREFLTRAPVRAAPAFEPPRTFMRYSNHLMTDGRFVGHGGYGGQFLMVDLTSGVVCAYLSVLENEAGYDSDDMACVIRSLMKVCRSVPA